MPERKTLRLLMPQWQGGGNPTYHIGARLLAWLAPESDAAFAEVPVVSPDTSSPGFEEGIFAKSDLLKQTNAAREIIRDADPDRIVTFGGDCSVALAPFSHLASKYAGDVAVLWIDSHSDLTSSKVYPYAHGYPMLNLLGQGDGEFAAFAEDPIPADRLIYVGVGKAEMGPDRLRVIEAMGATVFDPSELSEGFAEVIERVQATGMSKLLVHFDVDVLDPQRFRALMFNHPDGFLPKHYASIATGKLALDDVVGLITRCGEVAEIVALNITEHLPWDADNMRKALARLPILA
jgi:arginase